MNSIELLAPAKDLETGMAAINYGADAVYAGLSEFSLRAKADNFTEDTLKDTVDLVHQRNKNIYITVNIIPHNRDISRIREHLLFLKKIEVVFTLGFPQKLLNLYLKAIILFSLKLN